jgi:hypothetical protein
MELIGNWKTVLRKAWSVWLMVLAGIGEAASIGFVLLVGFAPMWLSITVLVLIVLGVPARIIAQKSIRDET